MRLRMFGKCFIGISVVVFVLALSVISSAQQKIVYTAASNGNGAIFIMNPDGTDRTMLTSDLENSTDAAISYDGSKITYRSIRNGNWQVFVMNSDGSNKLQLRTSLIDDSGPSINSDGSKIIWSCSVIFGANELCSIKSDGSSFARLTTNTREVESDPALSPDGTKVIYRSSNLDTNVRTLKVMNIDGSNSIVVAGGVNGGNPAFSPDGQKILFEDLTASGIWLMNLDGSNRQLVFGGPGITPQPREPAFSPDGNKIVFVWPNHGMYTINTDGTNLATLPGNGFAFPSWSRGPRRPVMIVPGIAGTYASVIDHDIFWLLKRGVYPEQLQIDPLARVYDDLIKTFENLGYVKNKDLFIVNYDWRLTPGPLDGSIDGIVDGITATSISDEQFEYGVDYLGRALRKAYEQWELDYPGQKLDEVDVIAHSTGGLVARTYVQSTAYNAEFAIDKKLPKVKNLIMVGVPNRGASKAWNPLNDNWNVEEAYRLVLSKIVDRAYQKVLSGCGGQGCVITGPDHAITRASISDAQGHPSHIKFINQYVPTMRSLLATYDFIDLGSGYTNKNDDLDFSNDWVLDLNDGFDYVSTADPSPFANRCTPTVIYTSNQPTPTFVNRILTGGTDAVLNFDDYGADDVAVGTPWFMDIPGLSGGDGTVPVRSAIGQFIGDSRVTLKEITTGNPDHTGLMSNLEAQRAILQTIGIAFQDSNISTVLAENQRLLALSITLDPVDGFVVDGAGRRLGFSESTGPITEIPGSIWVGDSDGMGWVFGPVVGPLRLELTGRGEPYYVVVSVETEEGNGGVMDSGFLALGETRSLPIIIGETADTTPPIVTPNVTGTLGSNGWYTSNVGVSWTVTDLESDISSQNGCSTQNITADTVGTTITCSATSSGGVASVSVMIKRDETAPSLSPLVTPNPVAVNGSAVGTANASDTMSGIATQSCDPVNTSMTGSYTVNCFATDNAGNGATSTAEYSVTGFQFTGFFQPVDNLPVLNDAKAGASIPVRFSLNGNQGLDIFAPGYPVSAATSCGTPSATSTIEETVNAGGSSLTYDAATDRYIYVWKTNSNWKGSCRILVVRFRDGSTYSASFRLR